jgi:ribosomal protein S18 acetylase RimI-like enzyme
MEEINALTQEIIVRRLASEDALQYRMVRLHGLLHDPTAFNGCHEEESRWPSTDFVTRIDKPAPSRIFGAFLATELGGTVAFDVLSSSKLRHKATLWGMYTLPKFRGYGIGRALLTNLLAYARNETAIEHILLSVTKSNRIASQWYENAGFQIYGIEPNAVKLEIGYDDDELRVLTL